MQYKVERVIVSFKDRLTRTGFGFFENLFKTFGTEIIVINDYTNEKSDTEELMEEIFTLLHSSSMKFYSKRKALKKCVENAVK
jgi:predicted site-specific integrase-resolvase